MVHPPAVVVVNAVQRRRIARQLAAAMARDVQAQRLLIKARLRGETSDVYWRREQGGAVDDGRE